MRVLEKLANLSESLSEKYLEWYRQRYIPRFGDLTANTRDMFLDQRSGLIHIYDSPNSIKLPIGTPMMCVGESEPNPEKSWEGLGMFKFQFGEHFGEIPERLIIYFRIVSRSCSALG